jgi:Papain family cysteine protease
LCAGVDDFCKLSGGGHVNAKPAVQMKKVVYIQPGNERAVMEAAAKHGPLSIGIDADCVPFRFYTSGVVNTKECTSRADNIDHAVLLVGYGDEDGAQMRWRSVVHLIT